MAQSIDGHASTGPSGIRGAGDGRDGSTTEAIMAEWMAENQHFGGEMKVYEYSRDDERPFSQLCSSSLNRLRPRNSSLYRSIKHRMKLSSWWIIVDRARDEFFAQEALSLAQDLRLELPFACLLPRVAACTTIPWNERRPSHERVVHCLADRVLFLHYLTQSNGKR